MNSILCSLEPHQASAAPFVGQWIESKVCAGFPSPAEDLGGQRLDLAAVLMTHPQATYFIRAQGHSMIDAGIDDGDILVVNKALEPAHGDIVVVEVDRALTVKRLFRQHGIFKLRAENPTYPDIRPEEGQTIEHWGVVTATIKLFRSRSA